MTIHTLAFYFLAGLAIISSLYVVLAKRPTYGVLSLTITMFSLSGLFVLLKAYFVAIIQILIYAGAILVLFLFVLMLIGIEGTTEHLKLKKFALVTFLTCLFLTEILTIISATKDMFSSNSAIGMTSMVGTIEEIGRSLFHHHLFAFEMVSFVLLVGVIGIVAISRKEDSKTT